MKKILIAFFIGCMSMVMTSCSDDSPKGVAKQGVECLMKKDFKGYVELLNIPDKDQENAKAGLVQMLEEKASKNPEIVDIKSYEIIDEQIDEETGTASVILKVVDTNGKEQEGRIDLVKNGKGEWKIKYGK